MNVDKESIAELLNRMPFVRWDRLSDTTFEPVGEDPRELRVVSVFGWIDRDDGRSDFVRVECGSWADLPGYCTSSEKYTVEIGELLGYTAHVDCIRVEDYFGDLVERKVVLG